VNKMEIVGDVDKFKERLDKIYQKKLAQELADINERERAMLAFVKKRKAEMKTSYAQRTEEKAELQKKKIINAERFRAKQELENVRGELISQAFKEAIKKAPSFVKTEPYINFVKANLPKSEDLILKVSKDLKDKFGTENDIKIEMDNNIIGVKAVEGKIVYDFTVTGLIEAKHESLRIDIVRELFDNS
jgi:vacuolar-type H+-ATPase subunit E/Vma4